MKSTSLVFVSAAWLLASAPASSHHSFAAEFDINKPVKLAGPVTRMEWTNPHAWIYVDAKDDKGNVQNWAIELVGINDLVRRGWGRNRVNAGDVVNVDGYAREERQEHRERSVGQAGQHRRAAVGQRAAHRTEERLETVPGTAQLHRCVLPRKR